METSTGGALRVISRKPGSKTPTVSITHGPSCRQRPLCNGITLRTRTTLRVKLKFLTHRSRSQNARSTPPSQVEAKANGGRVLPTMEEESFAPWRKSASHHFLPTGCASHHLRSAGFFFRQGVLPPRCTSRPRPAWGCEALFLHCKTVGSHCLSVILGISSFCHFVVLPFLSFRLNPPQILPNSF